ncbi:GNAT family N-acetyltransferase [Mycoplasma sp. P36-A1]|uniref:GNAT family N-acetyltransferase n=1 Tax=Mycoplasma sp. P36-A1 TaxID=3252900 RepID=UPI003C2C5BBA
MIKYRKIKKEEIEQVATLFSNAFYEDVLFNTFLNKHKNNKNAFYDLFLIQTKVFYKKQTCLVGIYNNEVIAASFLRQGDKTNLKLIDYLKAGGFSYIKKYGIKTVFNLLSVSKKIEKSFEPENPLFWFLELYAVSSKMQQEGIGSKMMERAIIPYIIKHNGNILNLTTNTPKNRYFYEKNGFKEIANTTIKKNRNVINNWCYEIKISKKNATIISRLADYILPIK